MREAVDAVEPAHPRGLHEHHEEDGDAGPVRVEQVHQVHAALRTKKPASRKTNVSQRGRLRPPAGHGIFKGVNDDQAVG